MQNNAIKIITDANCNMHYAAFYIDGLLKNFNKNVSFSFNEFNAIHHENQCFLFKVVTNEKCFNIAIDFHDTQKIDSNALIWSDLYAKINLNQEASASLLKKTNENKAFDFDSNWSKIISIPPSFGIRVFSLFQTFKYLLFIFKSKKGLSKKVFLDVLRMYSKRVPISNYYHQPFRQNYVFLIATIWHKTTKYVNLNRANFLRACKSNVKINLEGGLVDVGYECDYIDDLQFLKIGKTKINLSKYIQKTQQSNFVFNCPSVGYCHGWKLSEYLCLGKAIISTELSNDLPFALEHGKNIHFVKEDFESIKTAVSYLIDNPEYVKKLENGALEYWKKYCEPKKMIQIIIDKTLQLDGAN
jgi:hypothetical protein